MNFSANTTSTSELVPSNKSKSVDDRNPIDLDDPLNQRKRTSLPMVDSLLDAKKDTINDQLNNSYLSSPHNDDAELDISCTSSEFNGNFELAFIHKIK